MKQFLNMWCARLRLRFGTRGESITETLAAILICSLAILMLYTALASASRMNAAADEQSANLRNDIFAAETQGEPEEGLREVRVTGFEESYEVQYYGGQTGDVMSYRLP